MKMFETPTSKISPTDLGVVLARFADALLPGDDLFPPASATGSHGVMAERLRERSGPDTPDILARALVERGGLVDPNRAAALLETENPNLFAFAQMVLTHSYYEAPAVIAAIRALGHVYNEAPQPDGYALRPFDPSRDTPTVPRGHYLQTNEVTRVDLAGLGEIA